MNMQLSPGTGPSGARFSAETKDHVCGILQRGCDRETASMLIGHSMQRLRIEMQVDPEFACNVRRCEATCEFRHMENLHKAAQDPKNWRVSVWWLERRSPERFARRDPGVVTIRHVEAFVRSLAVAIVEEVSDTEDRQRLRDRLQGLLISVREMLLGDHLTANETANEVSVSSSEQEEEVTESGIGESYSREGDLSK